MAVRLRQLLQLVTADRQGRRHRRAIIGCCHCRQTQVLVSLAIDLKLKVVLFVVDLDQFVFD